MPAAPTPNIPSSLPTPTTVPIHLWRHPRPTGAEGRCIGQTDLPVDRRRAKRLAHRIRAQARRAGWPRDVHSSPLRRCADVGRWLKRWGWRHHVHPDWMELDFGLWDSRPWSDIQKDEVDAWCAQLATHRPGGRESLIDLCTRLQRVVHASTALAPGQGTGTASSPDTAPLLLIAHAGCMQALAWMAAHPAWATSPQHQPTATTWGPAPRYQQQLTVHLSV